MAINFHKGSDVATLAAGFAAKENANITAEAIKNKEILAARIEEQQRRIETAAGHPLEFSTKGLTKTRDIMLKTRESAAAQKLRLRGIPDWLRKPRVYKGI